MPIYFRNANNRKRRHEQWQKIVQQDEVWWKEKNPNYVPQQIQTSALDWVSFKSAVLGMATNYGLNVYQRKLLTILLSFNFYLFLIP